MHIFLVLVLLVVFLICVIFVVSGLSFDIWSLGSVSMPLLFGVPFLSP